MLLTQEKNGNERELIIQTCLELGIELDDDKAKWTDNSLLHQ